MTVEYVDKVELLCSLERKIKADNERGMAVVDSDFIDLVNDATEINDVVEVVRCRDCVYCDRDGRCEAPENGLIMEYVKPDDYCSYGERRSDESNANNDTKG